MKISRKHGGQRSQPRAESQHFRQRNKKSPSKQVVLGLTSTATQQQQALKSTQNNSLVQQDSSMNNQRNENIVHVKFINSNYSNQLSTFDNQAVTKRFNGQKNDKLPSKTVLDKISGNNQQLPLLVQQKPSLFGNAILQQNLKSNNTSFKESEGNLMIKNISLSTQNNQQFRYAQGNPARALRNKVKNDQSEGISHISSNQASNSKRPQSSLPQNHISINVQQIPIPYKDRASSKEKTFDQSATIQQNYSAQNIPVNDLVQGVGMSHRSNDSKVPQKQQKQNLQQSFLEKRKSSFSRQVNVLQQYNTSQTLIHVKQEPTKKQEGIQMLPSTNKHYKMTKREYFGRRMSSIDNPVLIITFQGVLGDFIKSQYFFQNKEQDQPAIQNLNIRVGLIQGLKFLCKNFQIVIMNNQDASLKISNKNCAERIQVFFQQNDIIVDALYSVNNDKNGNDQICIDYSQIYTDFNLNSLKKVQEKVIFVQSLDIDIMGNAEQIKIDQQGFFMFDYSQNPPKPLMQINLIHIYSKSFPLSTRFPQSQEEETKQKLMNILMPQVILVPNPKGNYSFQNHSLSFISIVKTIMTLSVLSQSKNKALVQDAMKLQGLKEWDIRLQPQLLSFDRIQCKLSYEENENPNQKDDNCDTTCTSSHIPSYDHKLHKQIKSFHTLNQHNSFEISSKVIRPTSSNSEEDAKNNFISNDDNQISYQLNDQFFQSINWMKSIGCFDSLKQSQMKSNILGVQIIQTDLPFRYLKHQLTREEKQRTLKEQRIITLKQLKQMPVNIPINPITQNNSNKIFTDIYEILKDQRTNGNPLSNMMNRNLRVFQNVKNDVQKQTHREIRDWESGQIELKKTKASQYNNYSIQNLQELNVINRIIVVGFDEPNTYFKTLQQGLEKYQGTQHHNNDDIEKKNRKNSLTKWIQINSQQNTNKKQRDLSLNQANIRPSSVNSFGGGINGGKDSGRSMAETSATILTNIGNLMNDI